MPPGMHRAAALPRAGSLPRPPRALLWAAVVAAVLAVGAFWVRDSSLVEVRDVTVTGIEGPDAPRIRSALTEAARDMTTLHIRTGQLDAVVASYPVVKSLSVQRDLPHGLRIVVHENTPVAAVLVDGARTPVGGDGRLLRGATTAALPIVPLGVAPGGDRVTDRSAMEAISALAAAPPALRGRVQHAGVSRTNGLVMDLRDGPTLRFGGAGRLAAKWAAAAAVLADPSSAGATYLDVRYPERPAAGGLEDPATQHDPSTADDALPAQTAPAQPAGSPTGTGDPGSTP